MSAPTRPRRVLFLIADTGAGHRSAANAIHHAMRVLSESPAASSPRSPVPGHDRPARAHANDGWEATIVDAFVECSRFPLRKGVFLYGPAIKHSPRLYGQFFRLTNTTTRFNAAARLARPFLYQGLLRLLLDVQPDVVVSVHPLLNHITLQVLRDLQIRIPFLTVVTDLVTIHCSWIAPGVTACAVPTESARAIALAAGVPSKRIHLLGMPIDPRFATRPGATGEALRRELGLDPDRPTVLLVGGGEGAIGLADAVMAVGHSDLNVQMVVVTGRNKLLYAQLQHARAGFAVPTQVLGFVHNMPDLMHAADIIVTKAGPGTITEAMACELPIVLTGAIPGQEEGNIDFVLQHDLGILARSPGAVVAALRELLTPGSPRLETLRANVRRMSRPEASFDIARLILKHLPNPDATSVWQRGRRAGGNRRYGLRARRGLGQPVRLRRQFGLTTVRRGRAGVAHAQRTLFGRFARRGDGQPRRLLGLTDLMGARALLLRGTYFGKVQLRRPSGGRGRHDARALLSSRRD